MGNVFHYTIVGGRPCHVRPCCSNVADLSIFHDRYICTRSVCRTFGMGRLSVDGVLLHKILLQASDAIGPSIYSYHELAHPLSQDFLSLGRDLDGVARPFSIRISADARPFAALHSVWIRSARTDRAILGQRNTARKQPKYREHIQRRCILAAYRKSQRFLAAIVPAPVPGRRLQELQFAARAADCSLGGRFLVLFPQRPDSSAGLNHRGHCSLRMLFLQCVYVLEISCSRIAVHSISVPTFGVCDHVRNNCCWSRLDSYCARFACICLRYILRGARPSFCKLLVAR